jgi:hypothetical protein
MAGEAHQHQTDVPEGLHRIVKIADEKIRDLCRELETALACLCKNDKYNAFVH